MPVVQNIFPEAIEDLLVFAVFEGIQFLEDGLERGRPVSRPAADVLRRCNVPARAREFGGDFLGDFSGGRPFGAALEGDDEPDALEGRMGSFRAGVSENGMEDTSRAVLDGEKHGLIAPCPAGFRCEISRRQHGQVLGRAAQQAVKLVAGMHPAGRQACRDGVRCVPVDN
jgi:hypothetical protein